MMVVTTSLLAPAAQTFAVDRTNHGVLSKVFVTDGAAGIGTTTQQIWTAINAAYQSTTCIRPSYVTLLGDTSQVPTFEISLGSTPDPTNPAQMDPLFYEDPVASDMPYGMLHQGFTPSTPSTTDLSQDVLVGRLPAADLATATTEVSAILAYDDNPPAAGAFYQHVTAAAFFQPCPDNGCANSTETPSSQDMESFLRSSQTAAAFAAAADKTVNRVTSDESDHDPTLTITPMTFDNGMPITPGLTFDPTTADQHTSIENDIQAGSFLVWHSDHGYNDGSGWYEPEFGVPEVDATTVTGSALPVIWSSDCDSGKFDEPTYPNVVPFTPAAQFSNEWMETGRAAGFVGSSRISPVETDGYLLDGMADGLFPETENAIAATMGIAPLSPVVELGALLEADKTFVVATAGYVLSTNYDALGTMYEYNDFGDPSTVIRRDVPRRVVQGFHGRVSNGAVIIASTQPGISGAVVTLVRGGQYVGRGIIEHGRATIESPTKFGSLKGLSAIVAGDGFMATSISLG
jgi:hypothetical protein